MKLAASLLLGVSLSVQAAEMIELRYRVEEPGTASYVSRILVTERFMRLDDGKDAGDFVLFDRQTGEVTNVLIADKILMRMLKKPLPADRPSHYRVEEKLVPLKETTVRLQMLADGKLCSETVSAKTLFPQASSAMQEFKAALAHTQLQTYLNTPEDIRQSCDLVHYVWESGRPLAHGLPIEERDYAGRKATLEESKQRDIDAGLFRVPAGYTILQLPH